ncbi:hypothetical protein JRQ81_014522 [Phrynocephalus forsythii]|uniref:Uncharacterized protein n=1 Tax=Phrynocephalus forsythii TaxID=171643 RepID=A0A9Q1B2X6_9SAUR|nr:hypothetical protein JRQ81_014522 [Phrynocephalus forsythii]
MASETGKEPEVASHTDSAITRQMRQMKAELAGLLSLSLKDMTRMFEDTKQELAREIKTTQKGVESIGQKLENLAAEFKRLDQLVAKNETAINSQKQELETAKKKIMYMEDYSRRQNVKLIEIQKKGEIKQEVLKWLNTFLPRQLTEEDIERIHFLGNSREGAPRPIIVRFASYLTKERLMSSIRANPDVLKRGDKVV